MFVIPECFYRGSSFFRHLESGFRLTACRNDSFLTFARGSTVYPLGGIMKRFLLLGMAALLFLLFAGCGDTGSDQPSSYVGVFKFVDAFESQVIITITKDDGTLYEGTYEGKFGKYSIKGTWGEDEKNVINNYTLTKGYDKYFIDFSFSFSLLESAKPESGTAFRQ